jgi:serine/threonine protein kinase
MPFISALLTLFFIEFKISSELCDDKSKGQTLHCCQLSLTRNMHRHCYGCLTDLKRFIFFKVVREPNGQFSYYETPVYHEDGLGFLLRLLFADANTLGFVPQTGEFVQLALLGSGASSNVYSGASTTHGPVVIKRFKHGFESELKTEIQVMEILSQVSGVPKLVSSGPDYLLSKSFGIPMRHNFVHEDFFPQLVDILVNVHSLRVVHRDIRPKNILIKKRDQTKPLLIDWGYAALLTRHESKYYGTKTFASDSILRLMSENKASEYKPSCSHDLESLVKVFFVFITNKNIQLGELDWKTAHSAWLGLYAGYPWLSNSIELAKAYKPEELKAEFKKFFRLNRMSQQ